MKICDKTGALYFSFDTTTWLLNLSFHDGAPIETLPMRAVFRLGFLGKEYVN
jgi:hypothetical protein